MGDAENRSPLPGHPVLREIAVALEAAGMFFEMLDDRFRCIYLSREFIEGAELTHDEVSRQLGRSQIVRTLTDDLEIFEVTKASSAAWFRHNAPIWRHYLDPTDADFADLFGPSTALATEIEPTDSPPHAWYDRNSFADTVRLRRTLFGDQHQVHLRINDDDGRFIGVVALFRTTLREGLSLRLGRGDPQLFERMDRVSEPGRRTAAILFADLEASSALSRRLSSRGYFDLIRDLTGLIDSSVISRGGITGKHAGDGGSALFLTADFGNSESGAARAAIETARTIRDGSAQLGPDGVEVKVNVGLHWGSTLMVGQIATTGRLEVTALGDQMNEGARIEAAAKGGAILAAKDLVERLSTTDAAETGVDPDRVVYTTLSELDGASDKAIRDAGTIAVTPI